MYSISFFLYFFAECSDCIFCLFPMSGPGVLTAHCSLLVRSRSTTTCAHVWPIDLWTVDLYVTYHWSGRSWLCSLKWLQCQLVCC